MMTSAVDLSGRALVDRATAYYGGGGTVTVRRRHSLISAGKILDPVTLDGVHAAGATTLTLKATRLSGILLPLIRLTIAGQVVEATNEVRAAGNKLAAVTITPGLTAERADGTVVAIEGHRDFTFRRMRGHQASELSEEGTSTGKQTVLLSTRGALTEPRSDDQLILGGLPEELEDVQAIQPGDVPWGWRLVRKGRAA
jgi:hypothetical protein